MAARGCRFFRRCCAVRCLIGQAESSDEGGVFGSPQEFEHPVLGRLVRTRGRWRGSLSLSGDATRLSIRGKRREPAPDDLALAATIVDRLDLWRPSVEAALLEHADDAGAVVDEFPKPTFVAVIALDGLPTIEFGFEVPWDDEHTIGVCLRDDVVVECNGSVLEP